MLRIELPWPDSRLSPNARGHWRIKEKARQAAIDTAYWVTLAEWQKIGKPKFLGFVKVYMTFCPPRRRSYDDDNLISRMKYLRDGMAKALRVDDGVFRQQAVEFGQVQKGGKVLVTLEPQVVDVRPRGLGIDGGDA